ncbi:cyclic nucleotide-binding domain-containing protein [Sporomusa sp.]|uniref:cyclic nucleotide-binding domain-containing protein n=1 Tax=Sporomusa sp. TaxID=2078658 RepID=UPI002C8A812D|nr:cyclic nucleotide-binding domain-containing protein [Sporomusa sp.]HWR06727.1 cyclic nucleotide-binding domain-containing protein [Sporomusa sp.]
MGTQETSISSRNKTNSALQVRIAEEPWEKSEIYKLRYQVYVQEMGKPLSSIFNKTKQIFDAMDDRSILLYVQAGSEIAATLRLTISSPDDYPSDIIEAFQFQKFRTISEGFAKSPYGLATKIAALAHYRSSPAFYLMLVESYRLLHDHKAPICFGGCNPSIVPLYERIGFRRFTKNFTDPGYGLLVPLVMVLEDQEHMRAAKSPIYRLARNRPNDRTVAQLFSKAFPEISKQHNSQLVTQESLSKYLEDKLSNNSPFIFPVFKYLDAKEVIRLLLVGVIFSCSPGDCIVNQDGLSSDLYILLHGTLVSSANESSHMLQPGDHFGNLTASSQSRQTTSVSAVTECEVFVLPLQAFERYQHLYQRSAQTLLSNLKATQVLSSVCIKTNQGGQHHE